MNIVPDVSDIVSKAEKELDDDAESIITDARYKYISSIIGGCYKKNKKKKLTASDKIDRVVTNRWLALPDFRCCYVDSVLCVGNHCRCLGH